MSSHTGFIEDLDKPKIATSGALIIGVKAVPPIPPKDEIVNVVSAWWAKHGIKGNFYQLRHITIPKTFEFAEPFLHIIEEKFVESRRIEQAKRRAKRRAEQIALRLLS